MASDRVRGNQKEKIVVLDSSMILVPFEFSIQLEEELGRLLGRYHIVVPSSVVRELMLLADKGRGRKKHLAKAGVQLIRRYEVEECAERDGDDAVLCLAQRRGAVVATNDKQLRKRLKECSIPVIFLREKQRLYLDE